jgi:hypothetical protein
VKPWPDRACKPRLVGGELHREAEQSKILCYTSRDVPTRKYPPAEPGALRLLAPQRGLIAIGQDQNKTVIVQPMIGLFVAVIPAKA